MKVVSVTEFKANYSTMLHEVQDCGCAITITKRGRPVAVLGPARDRPWKSPRGVLKGKIEIPDDIFERDTSNLWEVIEHPDA